LEASLLLLRREVGREEKDRKLAVLLERVGELAELILDQVELVVLPGDLEQRPRVDLCDLLHYRSRSPERAEKSSSPRASSTRRRWSASSSDLRVTFSVASTVRSATSARICWMAPRLSVLVARPVL